MYPQIGVSNPVKIEIKDLSQSYCLAHGRRHDVFVDVNLTVESGSMVVILGASGCGKSTLLNIITGLKRPSCGLVLADGEAQVSAVADHARTALVTSERLTGAVGGSVVDQDDLEFPVRLPENGVQAFGDVLPRVVGYDGDADQRIHFLD